jgi:hypothetical protein
MQNITCFQHPLLDSSKLPELSCKTCCSIFVSGIRDRQALKKTKVPSKWISEKERLTVGSKHLEHK